MSNQEIEQLETKLAQAMLDNDLDTLDRIISDDLMFTGPDGVLVTKAQDLALHRSGDIVFTKYEIDELIIQLYNPIAIANVKVKLAGSFKSESFASDYRYLRIYLKQNDRWQIIGGQVTAIMT
jgi:ketosteroid isomerase-like protein